MEIILPKCYTGQLPEATDSCSLSIHCHFLPGFDLSRYHIADMMQFYSRIVVTWLMMSYRVESTKEAVMLRISYLLRSDAKKNYESDQHYFEAHDVLSAKLGDEIKSKQAHPFVISLVSDCVRCHETVMQSAVTVERYRVISAEDAVFYGSLEEIKDLQALHPMSIKYFIPLIPDAKIDAALRSLYTTSISDGGCNGDTQDSQTSMTSIRISIIVAPLSDIDLATFIAEMLVLEAENNAEIMFEFKELLPEKERSMQGTIISCQNVIKFAVMLSKRREVLWIERRHDIRVNNKWARGICQSGSYADTPAFTSNLTGN